MVDPGPRYGPVRSGMRPQVSRTGWSIRFRPTWSLELATPEASSSRAFSIAWAASTTTLARTVRRVTAAGRAGSSYRWYSTPVIRPVGSVRSRSTTARVSRVTPGAQRSCVRRGVYFAPVGQMGMQLALPSQTGPCSSVAELLRAWGVPTTRSAVGCGCDGSWTCCPSSRSASIRSRWLAGTGRCGKEYPSAKGRLTCSRCSARSPATPSSRSAAR